MGEPPVSVVDLANIVGLMRARKMYHRSGCTRAQQLQLSFSSAREVIEYGVQAARQLARSAEAVEEYGPSPELDDFVDWIQKYRTEPFAGDVACGIGEALMESKEIARLLCNAGLSGSLLKLWEHAAEPPRSSDTLHAVSSTLYELLVGLTYDGEISESERVRSMRSAHVDHNDMCKPVYSADGVVLLKAALSGGGEEIIRSALALGADPAVGPATIEVQSTLDLVSNLWAFLDGQQRLNLKSLRKRIIPLLVDLIDAARLRYAEPELSAKLRTELDVSVNYATLSLERLGIDTEYSGGGVTASLSKAVIKYGGVSAALRMVRDGTASSLARGSCIGLVGDLARDSAVRAAVIQDAESCEHLIEIVSSTASPVDLDPDGRYEISSVLSLWSRLLWDSQTKTWLSERPALLARFVSACARLVSDALRALDQIRPAITAGGDAQDARWRAVEGQGAPDDGGAGGGRGGKKSKKKGRKKARKKQAPKEDESTRQFQAGHPIRIASRSLLVAGHIAAIGPDAAETVAASELLPASLRLCAVYDADVPMAACILLQNFALEDPPSLRPRLRAMLAPDAGGRMTQEGWRYARHLAQAVAVAHWQAELFGNNNMTYTFAKLIAVIAGDDGVYAALCATIEDARKTARAKRGQPHPVTSLLELKMLIDEQRQQRLGIDSIDDMHQSFSQRRDARGGPCDSSPATSFSSNTLKRCDNCAKVEEEAKRFKTCSACKRVRYCSPQCQKSHWPSHKQACKAARRSASKG